MDVLLETGAVSFGQAARFVLVTAERVEVHSAPSAAYALAREKGWVPEGATEHRPIRTGELSFLIMNAFDMKGSFLYRFFPGSRYAFRELDYRGLLPGRRDPALRVSGEGLIRILGMTSVYLGRGDAEVPVPQDTPAEPEVLAEVPAAIPPLPEVTAPVPAPPEVPIVAPPPPEIQAEVPLSPEIPVVAPPPPEVPAVIPSPPEIPVTAPTEVPPPSLQEQREETAEYVRAELDRQEIADTTVRVAEEGVVISLDNIQFTADSAVLTPMEQDKLREIAGILSRYPDRKILVGGHTALAGTEGMRLQISRERAGAVADFLVSLGVRRDGDILVQGYGAQQPLGDNATEAGRALNRRVEIILMDE
jgi:outer membrane protein OmpA-like peptidoglycan-associated protein